MSTFLWQAEFNSARAAVGADSPADLREEVVQTSTKGIEGAVHNAFVFEAQFTQFFNATPKALGLPVQSHVDADGHPQDRCINARLSPHVLSCTARGEGLSAAISACRLQCARCCLSLVPATVRLCIRRVS